MSYSRWGGSSWYSFYNVNGKLSLWYDMEHTIDWEHRELVEIMQQDPEKIPLVFKEIYTCSLDEAKEAITYVQLFMEDYDPKDVVEYKQEVEFLLNTWEKIENDKGSD